MKPTLVPGLTVTRSIAVDRERTVAFLGENARVYATPMLVRDIEVVARELVLPHLDAGHDTVGTRIEIDHLAATPLGMEVEITVSVASVSGRAISLEVSARDSIDLVCRGRHQRYAIDVGVTEARVAAKSRKAGFQPSAARA
jgi:predicted thioesterase